MKAASCILAMALAGFWVNEISSSPSGSRVSFKGKALVWPGCSELRAGLAGLPSCAKALGIHS
jgi:hypothetical protein